MTLALLVEHVSKNVLLTQSPKVISIQLIQRCAPIVVLVQMSAQQSLFTLHNYTGF